MGLATEAAGRSKVNSISFQPGLALSLKETFLLRREAFTGPTSLTSALTEGSREMVGNWLAEPGSKSIRRQKLCLLKPASALQEKRPLKNVNAEYVSWSEAAECEYIKRCHVGIMPLTDDEFSRGKSAYKLLQYQAGHLPLIASPVGENKRVVIPDENGFLAENIAQWQLAFERLEKDEQLYEKYSAGAGKMAYNYSLQKYFTIYKDFINSTFKLK